MAIHFYLLILPLIFSNIAHMLVVKRNWFSWLAVPVSERFFGRNKTLRGFLLLPLLNGIAMAVLAPLVYAEFAFPSFLTGLSIGLAYLLFELPNSYLKRSLGIAPGESAATHRWLFKLLDKTDSALGVCLAYFLLCPTSLTDAVWLFLIGSGTHMLLSLMLVNLKLKQSY